jgi:monoamine oxidase
MRTPLFAVLRRVYRHHRAVAPVAPVAQELRLSRRTFLASSAALVASSCGPNPPAPSASVAIVGVGLAGLHCGYHLLQLGVTDITIFEATDRIGGRVLSDRTTFAPLHAELGAELIDSEHETILGLVDEFGLDLLDYRTDDAALDDALSFFAGRRLSAAELLTAFAPIAARIDQALATITGDGSVSVEAANNGEALDTTSLRDWLDALVRDGVIAADNVARAVIEVAYTCEFGRETSEQSALNLLFSISTSTDAFSPFGEADEVFTIAGGNDAVVTALAAPLAEHIASAHQLTALSRTAGGRFALTFADGKSAEADEVVLALPFSTLRDVVIDPAIALSAAKRLAIDTLGYGTGAKLMVGFTSRFWRNGDDGNTSDGSTYSDTGYQASWETSRLQSGDAGILTNFTGGLRGTAIGVGTPQERAAEFVDELNGIFPGIAEQHNGAVARLHWPTHAAVKGSYACYLPGQYTTIAGAEGTSEADGHLHFCGEHTSQAFQGYMEGALETGAAAALAVARNVGRLDGQALSADTPAARIRARASRLRQLDRAR